MHTTNTHQYAQFLVVRFEDNRGLLTVFYKVVKYCWGPLSSNRTTYRIMSKNGVTHEI